MLHSNLKIPIASLAVVFLILLVTGCGYVAETNFVADTSGPTRSDIPWWDDAWSFRRMLTFYNSGQTEDLIDFPVLIRLTSSRISYGATQNSGEDIRFIDADGSTVLKNEIELWNESGESIVWVKVPQIDGSSTTDYIMMYYGNDSAPAPDALDAQNVWDSNYFLVWHLNQEPAGGSDILDSTATQCYGVSNNMEPADRVSGYIGYGVALDGSSKWIDPSEASLDQAFFHDPFSYKTFEILLKANNTSADQTLFDEGGSTNGFYINLNTNNLGFMTRNSSSQITISTAFTDTSSYHYIAAVFDNGTLIQYLDASPQNQTAGYPTINTHSGEPGIGSSPDSDASGHSSAGYYLNGIIDEVRLSDIARSADWIAAQQSSMTGTFITYGNEEY
jgi:hypothetical protein